MTPPRGLLAAALLLGAGASAHAQFLLVPESTNDTVMLLDAADGTLLNAAYIDVGAVGGSTPIEAQVVGNEIWVSDQLADQIFRFTTDGATYLGSITGALDNLRGLEVVGNTLYVSNAGTGNGAPGDSVVTFDLSGAPTGSFPTGDPFDVLDFNGLLLVSDSVGDDIEQYAYDGTPMGSLIAGGTMNWPEQMTRTAAGGLLIATFLSPTGVFEFDSAGAQIDFFPAPSTGGMRGGYRLGNGNILMTDDDGAWVYDPVGGTHTNVAPGTNARFINPFAGDGSAFTAFCAGDGSATACPCGNESPAGAGAGCLHSFGTGGLLSVSGAASVAGDSVLLAADGLPPTAPALYFQGTAQQNGGLGDPFGDGLRCVSGTVIRLGTKTSVGGSSSYGQPNGDTPVSVKGMLPGTGGQRYYQAWYRNTAVFCTSAGFNLTNAIGIDWQP